MKMHNSVLVNLKIASRLYHPLRWNISFLKTFDSFIVVNGYGFPVFSFLTLNSHFKKYIFKDHLQVLLISFKFLSAELKNLIKLYLDQATGWRFLSSISSFHQTADVSHKSNLPHYDVLPLATGCFSTQTQKIVHIVFCL